jgi:hypothetical protein
MIHLEEVPPSRTGNDGKDSHNHLSQNQQTQQQQNQERNEGLPPTAYTRKRKKK